MNAPVALVTAKAHSERLPGKNMLPLSGQPLAFWSINEARRNGLETVVSTDIPRLAEKALSMGCRVVMQNPSLGHEGVIKAAVAETGFHGSPIILLQPTSPFRHGEIVARCWRSFVDSGGSSTVLTSNVVHDARVSNGSLVRSSSQISLWDGNVAIYPAGKLCDYESVVCVRNPPINNVQIDTEEDYVMACVVAESIKPTAHSLPNSVLNLLGPLLRLHGISGRVTLVGRPNGIPIPQDRPVAYVNHCRGYDGGRCDLLFVIANEAIRRAGINPELRECASKAKMVVVRHNGELAWLLQNLPEITQKHYSLRECINSADDRLTTGCIAADMLSALGIRVDFVGIYQPGKAVAVLGDEKGNSFHYPAISREIALFYQAGVY